VSNTIERRQHSRYVACVLQIIYSYVEEQREGETECDTTPPERHDDNGNVDCSWRIAKKLRTLLFVGLEVEDGEEHQVAVDDEETKLVAPSIERRALAVQHIVVVERCQMANIDENKLNNLQQRQIALHHHAMHKRQMVCEREQFNSSGNECFGAHTFHQTSLTPNSVIK
jgi:hypothetical protein